ncbi:MAG: hypothetical protein Q8L02_08150 [Candidatus Nitrotoga sp.]|nr:hypothetical protein [Candidatus Nitrotoga sp.]
MPANATDVVEFYNTILDNYFITADTNEATAIDGGSAGPGWTRTGETFKSGGSTPVCRFYGSQSPGPNSHFYTVDTNECQGLKDTQFSANDPRKLTVKSWNFEALDFISTPPTGDQCPLGTMPVYRAYNNGFSRGVDSNHRISINPAAIAQVVRRGWINEGVVMCAESQDVVTQPPATNVTVFTDSGNPLLMSFIPKGGKQTTLFGKKNAEGAATAIDGMYIQETPTSKHLILFDGDGRPSKITTADGATMTFSWGSGGQVSVNYVTANGQNQVNIPFPKPIIPLTQPIAKSSFSIPKKTVSEALVDRWHTWIEVIVHEQGVPVSNATVFASLESRFFTPPPIPLLERSGSPGLYTAFIESNPSLIPPGAVEGICNKALDAASNFCTFGLPLGTFMMEGGCLLLAEAVSLIGTPVAGGAAFAACEVVMDGIVIPCTFLEAASPYEDGTKAICRAVDKTVGAIDPDGLVISITAQKYDAKGSSTKPVSGRATVANFEVELTCPPPQKAHEGKCINDFELILTKNIHLPIECKGPLIWDFATTTCGEADIEIECRGVGCVNERFSGSIKTISGNNCKFAPSWQDSGFIYTTNTRNIAGSGVGGTGIVLSDNPSWVEQAFNQNMSCEFSWEAEVTVTSSSGITKTFKVSPQD